MDELLEVKQGLRSGEEVPSRRKTDYLTSSQIDYVKGLAAEHFSNTEPSEDASAEGSFEYESFWRVLSHEHSRMLEEFSDFSDSSDLPKVIMPTAIRHTTEKLSAEQEVLELKEKLYNDPVSGVLSKEFYQDEFGEIVQSLIDDNRDFVYFYLDGNKFKAINDTHGHEAGDAAIRAIGNRLKNSTRSSDYVVNRGGDEFVVLVLDVTPEEGLEIARRINKNDEDGQIEFDTLNDTRETVSVSVGVATSRSAETFSQIDRNAETAMYVGKNSKSEVTVFQPEMKMPEKVGR